MKKYLAIDSMTWLGTKHDSREEAEKALVVHNCAMNSWTGYCAVFGHFSEPFDGYIIEYNDDEIITKEEYEKILVEKEEAEKELDKEIEKLREKYLGKYNEKIAIYHNQVKWQKDDELEIITRQKYNHRLKIMKGRVYDTVINKDGELMPALAQDKDRYVPETHYIQGIKIVGNHRGIPNHHCYDGGHYVDGKCTKFCQHYDKENKKCKLYEDLISEQNDTTIRE